MAGSRTGKLKYLFLELVAGEGQVPQGLDLDQSGEFTLFASFIKLNLLITGTVENE